MFQYFARLPKRHQVDVAKGLRFGPFVRRLGEWGYVAQNNKYANNYDYHKAVWLLNQEI